MTHPRSANPVARAEQPDGYAGLLHELNQRYYQQWLRAERLERELALTRGRLFGPFLAWMRWLKRQWRPHAPEAHPAFPICARLEEVPDHVPGRVSVIIPFRDRLELLRTCVRSLRRTTTEPIEIVLVDHESQEPTTRRWLRKVEARPGVSVVRETGPFNFSRLCNAGARRASGDYLLFLNNDTECLTPEWPQRFKRLAVQSQVGAVGALLIYPDQTVQHAGLFPQDEGRWVHAGRGQSAGADLFTGAVEVPAATGACLCLRRDLFDQIRGFEERLPVTYNDVDLCRRAKEMQRMTVVTFAARFIHYEGLTRGFSGDEPGRGHLEALASFPVGG